jgi:hypothetical protein
VETFSLNLAKVGVEGSNPFARSNLSQTANAGFCRSLSG